MKTQLVMAVLISGMSSLVGCQTNHAVVRGQTPTPNAPQSCAPMAPVPGPIYYNGPSGASAMNCPPNHCHPHGAECPLCAPDNFWVPTHHHTYDYKQPKGLVYPPQNQPAGAVVYPYYTLKGPSDFFMK